MDGYHPPILTTPRNKSFLEENGELPSANVPFLLSIQSNLPNKELKFKVFFFFKRVLRPPMLSMRLKTNFSLILSDTNLNNL